MPEPAHSPPRYPCRRRYPPAEGCRENPAKPYTDRNGTPFGPWAACSRSRRNSRSGSAHRYRSQTGNSSTPGHPPSPSWTGLSPPPRPSPHGRNSGWSAPGSKSASCRCRRSVWPPNGPPRSPLGLEGPAPAPPKLSDYAEPDASSSSPSFSVHLPVPQ